MQVTFTVTGQTPSRTHPGRCADRRSPNAAELAKTALEVIERSPGAFPIREGFGLTVRAGRQLPKLEGYDVDDAIIEVLVDVGFVADERHERWWRSTIDESMGDSYEVTLDRDRGRD
jgi:hypothetical protein